MIVLLGVFEKFDVALDDFAETAGRASARISARSDR